MCAMGGRRRIGDPAVGCWCKRVGLKSRQIRSFLRPRRDAESFFRPKSLIPYCLEKPLSLAYADRTVNQHRWAGRVDQGA